jgi:hypothetical protein
LLNFEKVSFSPKADLEFEKIVIGKVLFCHKVDLDEMLGLKILHL